MQKNKAGFTLIELLVVIAIIGLLSTLSILALNTARARARDTKRVADVKQIQTALEMAFNDMGVYPLTASVTAGGAIKNTAGTVFLSMVPTPPTPSNDGSCTTPAPAYTYTSAAGTTYTINYCLGAQTGGVDPGNQVATPAGIH